MFAKNYIIHYKPNIDRRSYLLQNEYLRNSDTEWREDFQQESDADFIINSNQSVGITKKELLVFLSHQNTLNQILKDDISSFIIWEDDVLINEIPNTFQLLKNIYDQFVNSDVDVVFLGKIPGLEVTAPEPNKFIYTNVKQCSVCTHAYSIKHNRVEEINDTFEYNLPVDHDFNRVIEKLKLKVAWSYPAFEQGSITSKYNSNIR
jgi:GR25 family glycosyltransferase involved in LPS biosynthesis